MIAWYPADPESLLEIKFTTQDMHSPLLGGIVENGRIDKMKVIGCRVLIWCLSVTWRNLFVF
jgi:hypothetical protein